MSKPRQLLPMHIFGEHEPVPESSSNAGALHQFDGPRYVFDRHVEILECQTPDGDGWTAQAKSVQYLLRVHAESSPNMVRAFTDIYTINCLLHFLDGDLEPAKRALYASYTDFLLQRRANDLPEYVGRYRAQLAEIQYRFEGVSV